MGCCFIEPRDRAVLEKIVEFCERIENHIRRNQGSKDVFMSDIMFQDACLLSVIQIGELVVLLSDEAKAMAQEVPWRTIKDTRNVYVHKYGTVDLNAVWATINKDIPKPKSSCVGILDGV